MTKFSDGGKGASASFPLIVIGEKMNEKFSFEENFEKLKEQINNINNSDQAKSIVKWIYSLNPIEFTSSSFLIGLILGQTLNFNEQIAIGNFLIEIGQVLLTLNSQTNLRNQNNSYSNEEIDLSIYKTKSELNKKLAFLQNQINSIINTTNQELK